MENTREAAPFTEAPSPASPTETMTAASPVAPVTVVLAEDIAILRKGLRATLQAFDTVEVVGEAQDGLEAVAVVERLAPDVVLMDLCMPRLGGAEAIAAIKAIRPRTRVLVLTAGVEVEQVRATLAAGADGYLLKNVAPEALLAAVLQVTAGRPFGQPCVCPEIAALLIGDRGPAGVSLSTALPDTP